MIPTILCIVYPIYLYYKLNRELAEATESEVSSEGGIDASNTQRLSTLISRLKILEERLANHDSKR